MIDGVLDFKRKGEPQPSIAAPQSLPPPEG